MNAIAAEHTFKGNFFVSGAYEFNRGVHQLRVRNLNAPLPGTTTRPDPTRGNVVSLEATGFSRCPDLRSDWGHTNTAMHQFSATVDELIAAKRIAPPEKSYTCAIKVPQ